MYTEDIWRQKLVAAPRHERLVSCLGIGSGHETNERLHYGKMAAVSVMRMRTGSYAHIIVLINFGIP